MPPFSGSLPIASLRPLRALSDFSGTSFNSSGEISVIVTSLVPGSFLTSALASPDFGSAGLSATAVLLLDLPSDVSSAAFASDFAVASGTGDDDEDGCVVGLA